MEKQKVENKLKFITRQELSQLLKLHISTVDKMIERGCPHYKIGDTYRFEVNEVLSWTKGNK